MQKSLHLGNLSAKRDWGLASEYVECMWKMLQQKKPDDYVIATGEAHTVQEFVEKAFQYVNLDWKKYVKTDKRFMRPLEVNYLQGNNSNIAKKLKWKPKVNIHQLINEMIKVEYNYINEAK